MSKASTGREASAGVSIFYRVVLTCLLVTSIFVTAVYRIPAGHSPAQSHIHYVFSPFQQAVCNMADLPGPAGAAENSVSASGGKNDRAQVCTCSQQPVLTKYSFSLASISAHPPFLSKEAAPPVYRAAVFQETISFPEAPVSRIEIPPRAS
ncbi:MAG: hypothetical protein HYX80_03180 [Chloroflexi bacterium]|nr:hypothetical protein [Chloroflexota bacterium]